MHSLVRALARLPSFRLTFPETLDSAWVGPQTDARRDVVDVLGRLVRDVVFLSRHVLRSRRAVVEPVIVCVEEGLDLGDCRVELNPLPTICVFSSFCRKLPCLLRVKSHLFVNRL